MTEKIQKLSKNLTEEKAAAEKLQKSNSSQITQQTSENRKMALEISKLKVHTHTGSPLKHVHAYMFMQSSSMIHSHS